MCPKCHGMMGNPAYSKDQFDKEWLERRCHTCGYATRNPTADAKHKTEMHQAFEDLMMKTTGCKFVDVTTESKDREGA